MKNFLRYVTPGHLVVVVLLLIAAFFAYATWQIYQPESSGTFEMTGIYQEQFLSGSLCFGCGEEHNTTEFVVVVTQEESKRIEQYTWLRKSQWKNPEGHPGMVQVGLESTGNWCGSDLPPAGAFVTVSSPSGFTKDVVIRNLATSKTYRPTSSNCPRKYHTYHYILFDANMKIFAEGTEVAADPDDAAMLGLHKHTSPTTSSGYQVWKDGDPVPTPYPGMHR